MTDQSVGPAPDYELDDVLQLETPEQYRAVFEETRSQIVHLLLERAATIKELAETLEKPKGTIGHHVAVLEGAGLIRIVRTKMVRAIEAKYYGRTARTYWFGDSSESGIELDPNHFLMKAASEFSLILNEDSIGHLSSLRYARIPDDRAREWEERLGDLLRDFTAEERGGETTYGLLVAMYPTQRPHLPDPEDEK
jgi:DNA-binding transcriptional ArsR family regulator